MIEITIHKHVFQEKINRLLRYISFLQRIRAEPIEAFLNSEKSHYSTAFIMYNAAQICIDIAFHVCTKNNYQEPENYKDAFIILAQNSIITQELSNKMQQWAGLRNLIAHQYGKVDNQRLYEILQNDLTDLESFVESIRALRIE